MKADEIRKEKIGIKEEREGETEKWKIELQVKEEEPMIKNR